MFQWEPIIITTGSNKQRYQKSFAMSELFPGLTRMIKNQMIMPSKTIRAALPAASSVLQRAPSWAQLHTVLHCSSKKNNRHGSMIRLNKVPALVVLCSWDWGKQVTMLRFMEIKYTCHLKRSDTIALNCHYLIPSHVQVQLDIFQKRVIPTT